MTKRLTALIASLFAMSVFAAADASVPVKKADKTADQSAQAK